MEKYQDKGKLPQILTLISLILILGVSCLSLIKGFRLGNQAMQGMSHRLDARTLSNSNSNKRMSSLNKKLVMLKEEDILNSVNVWIKKQEKTAKQHRY